MEEVRPLRSTKILKHKFDKKFVKKYPTARMQVTSIYACISQFTYYKKQPFGGLQPQL